MIFIRIVSILVLEVIIILKIKLIKAATLYEYNLGIRDTYASSDAMLCRSLFYDFIRKNGLRDYKNKSTRDIICLDFGFGTRSYEEDLRWAEKNKPELIDKIKSNCDKYEKLNKFELRKRIYENGITVNYPNESIHYRMLYRNPSKAKTGQVMMINEDLLDVAREWLTMGLWGKTDKIVELSAYAPLTTSTIVDKVKIPVEDVLILKDQESVFETIADVVGAGCKVTRERREVKNVIWDGMALIDESVCPDWINGMCLLRNHFFKACAFKTRIKDFLKDNNAEDMIVKDVFGAKHRLGDVKVITTESATKWLKFKDLIDYKEWKKRINRDGSMWGIVKTDHESKLGHVQQMSYQMINTLPCRYPDISDLTKESVEYVNLLKSDDEVFLDYLEKNKTIVNHYEMLKALYRHNPNISRTQWFTDERASIIRNFISRLRSGKIRVQGDNLTVCGNPYALLLYAIGEDWEYDPTLNYEDGAIQCYTKRFDDGEYLCAMRSPHNSSNNVAYFHNCHSEEMEKYFCFSNNIIAVNCINSDIQDRMNGEDFDSDFNFVSNNPVLVHCAKRCYEEYPTVVNEIPEDNKVYGRTMEDFAIMDDMAAKAQADIGESSNLAQLAVSYYWTELSKREPDDEIANQLYENFVVLAVLAQLAIDGIKRIFDVNVRDEINRIKSMPCMNMYDGFPQFMKYIREVKKVDDAISCPMNWLEISLNAIKKKQRESKIDIREFLNTADVSRRDKNQVSRIRRIVTEYYLFTRDFRNEKNPDYNVLVTETEEIINKIAGLKIGAATMSFLIKAAFAIDHGKNNRDYSFYIQNRRKLLALLYKGHPKAFLSNFLGISDNS